MTDDIRLANDGGKRWRIEGPGWTMEPVGHVTAAEARGICVAAIRGFKPRRRPSLPRKTPNALRSPAATFHSRSSEPGYSDRAAEIERAKGAP